MTFGGIGWPANATGPLRRARARGPGWRSKGTPVNSTYARRALGAIPRYPAITRPSAADGGRGRAGGSRGGGRGVVRMDEAGYTPPPCIRVYERGVGERGSTGFRGSFGRLTRLDRDAPFSVVNEP